MDNLPQIKSTYAIVDVMRGRKALAKHIKRQGPVRVLIEATLTEPFGHDDGESIEFCADVHSIRYVQALAKIDEIGAVG